MLVSPPDVERRERRIDEACGHVQAKRETFQRFWIHARQSCQVETRSVRSVRGAHARPFDPCDVGQVAQFRCGSILSHKICKISAVGRQPAMVRRVAGHELLGHRREKIGADEPSRYRIDVLHRYSQ